MKVKHKTLIVTGETITRDNKRTKTLGDNVDKVVNDFLGTIKAVDGSVDVKHQVTLGGVDYDFVSITYAEAEAEKKK